MSASISIIVPVLDEAEAIQSVLQDLRSKADDAEIIVVDGGSDDKTASLAADLSNQVLITEANRGVQMNAGAAASHGDILWFLHADVRIPVDAMAEINRILADETVVAGFFRIQLPASGFVYRLTDSLAHYLGLLLRMRCGDHGMFCRRQAFTAVRGFPEVPLMEDAEFFRRLHRHGKIRWSRRRITVSPRRYEQIGPARLTFFYGLIGALYALGVPLSKLATIYSRFCQPSLR